MGCFQTKERMSSCTSALFLERVREAIDRDSKKDLELILRVLCKMHKGEGTPLIDQVITQVNSYKMNPLAYSVYIGAHRSFKFLHEKGASLNLMDELLDSQGLCAINLLCLKGHLELLKLYLPIYLSRNISIASSKMSFTLDFKESDLAQRKTKELALHSACRGGMIGIVSFLYGFFKQRPIIPKDFDFNATDEENGENLSLLACRFGNFAMIKMLHETCQVEFTGFNVHNENALMICISGYKRKPGCNYIECIQYLIESIKIDFTYNCEEMLLMAENAEIVNYLETKLEEKGIFVKKKDVEVYNMEFNIGFHVEDDNCKQNVFTEEVRKYLRGSGRPSLASTITERISKPMGSSLISYGVAN